MTSVQKLAAQLQQPSPEELKEELELADEEPTEEEVALEKDDADDKTREEYTFTFDWKSGEGGKRFTGSFTNKILDMKQKSLVGIMRARLSGGVPYASLDPMTQEINLIISHLTFSLVKRPKWAMDLQGLKKEGLLQAIFEEVASHEATFPG